jgi:hypothetical protein
MKPIFLIAALVFCTLAHSQTGLQKIPLQPFNQLEINGDITVYLNQTDEETISASADDLASIKYEVSEGKLKISGEAGKIYLHLMNIEKIMLKGSSEVYSSDTLKGEKLVLSSTGSGDANLLTKYNYIDVSVSGASDVKLAGNTNSLIANVSGSGDLRAYSLLVTDATININGAGDAKVHVSNTLKGDVSGAGTLFYQGIVKQIDSNITGAGEIKRSNSLADNDTTRIRVGRREIIILDEKGRTEVEIGDDVMIDNELKNSKSSKKRPQYIWSGFEMGINGWLNADNTLNMDSVNTPFALNYGKSLFTNLNFWEVKGKVIGENLMLSTGMGLEINNYRFENNTRLVKNSPGNPAVIDSIDYTKSKLTLAYLNVPLYITFATNPLSNGKRLSISPGITGGWRVISYNKLMTKGDGGKQKAHLHDDFNMQPFRVNASLRIAYGNFVLFGNYSLNGLFNKNKGPDIMPFSVGIRIIGLGKS